MFSFRCVPKTSEACEAENHVAVAQGGIKEVGLEKSHALCCATVASATVVAELGDPGTTFEGRLVGDAVIALLATA